MVPKSCSFTDCPRTHLARGYCASHLYQLKSGKPLRPIRKRGLSVEDRFIQYVDKSGDCWEWTGGKLPTGYGTFNLPTGSARAHRVAFSFENGPIPEGAEVEHSCLNRSCVKPEHLRLATRKQNMENRAGANSNSVSGLRGVSYRPDRNKWTAYVVNDGKQIHLGYFDSPEAADAVATAKRLELFTHNELDRAANVSA